jgi:hypothetical protein
MLHQESYLSSRRGVYSGMCVLMASVFGILLSSGLGQYVNTTYSSLPSSANIPGIESSGTIGNHELLNGYVINGDAGSFVHLSLNAQRVLELVLIGSLVLVVMIAVSLRSWLRVTAPCLVILTLMALFNGGFSDQLNQVLPAEAGILLGIGVVASIALERWRFAVRRTPSRPTPPAGSATWPRERTGPAAHAGRPSFFFSLVLLTFYYSYAIIVIITSVI